MLFNFLLVLFLGIIAFSQEEFLENTNFRHETNVIKIFEVVKQSDFSTCVVYYKPDKNQDKLKTHEKVLKKLSNDMQGLVNFLAVDCNKIIELEGADRITVCGIDEMLPMVVFSTPKQKRYDEKGQLNSPEESIYGGDMTFSKLQEFAQRYIAVFRKLLNTTEDLNDFLNNKEVPNKVILFTDQVDTPNMFKGITSYLRDRLDFAEIRNTRSKKQLIERYKIQKFPTILVLKYNVETDFYDEEIYDGPKKLEKITEYLEQFAKETRIIRSDDRGADSPIVKPITKKTYEPEILENSNFVLIHIYKKKFPHPAWGELVSGFDKIFDYYQLDCDTSQNEEFAKTVLGAKSLPIIKYYPYGLQKKVKTKLFFTFQDKVLDILNELNQVIDDKSTTINDQSSRSYFVEALKDKTTQLVFFGDSDYSSSSLFYKALTNIEKYNSVMKFARYMQPNQAILKSLSIERVPTLMGFLSDSGKVAHFRLEMTAKNMRDFFEQVFFFDDYQHIIKHKQQYKKITNQANTQNLIKNQIVEIQSNDIFEKFCNPKTQNFCFIALIDANKRESQMHNAISELGQQLQKFSQIAEKFSDKEQKNIFLWVDFSCFPETLLQLNLNRHQMPNLIAFDPYSEKFALLKKAFTFENLDTFINKILTKKKVVTRHLIQEGFDFYSQSCVKKFAESNKNQQKEDL